MNTQETFSYREAFPAFFVMGKRICFQNLRVYYGQKQIGETVMCTSIALKTKDFYFGRNLDLEYGFGERVVIAPRNFPFEFRKAGRMDSHYAMIGMAAVQENVPLYAEAVNEKGLCIAGLNFPGNAFYPEGETEEQANISPFELTAWLLGQCASVREARELLKRTRLIRINFSEAMPLTPLHWHIADRDESIVLEPMRDGMRVHENPVGVLTNNPPFDFQMTNLCQYLNLTSGYPKNRFSAEMNLEPFGVGMGALGLPGDFSPVSRFVKTAFLRLNSVSDETEAGSVSRFFHLLDAAAMPDGIVKTKSGPFEYTRYSCCMNADRGVFYYKTYLNSALTAVDMHRENLEADSLIEYPLMLDQRVEFVN